jgi:hypothetical protein
VPGAITQHHLPAEIVSTAQQGRGVKIAACGSVGPPEQAVCNQLTRPSSPRVDSNKHTCMPAGILFVAEECVHAQTRQGRHWCWRQLGGKLAPASEAL